MFRTLTIAADSSVSVSDQADHVMPGDAGTLRWIDLLQQDAPNLAILAERFGFHPLTIEDCLHFDQRPKLEVHDGYLFLVLHGFRVDWDDMDKSDGIELHMFIGDDFFITVHEGAVAAVDEMWHKVKEDGRLAGHQPGHLCYMVADSLIDSYFPLIDDLLFRIDLLEDRILEDGGSVCLNEILSYKRLLVNLRKILSPQRDVLALLSRHGQGMISEQVLVYFRDVYDHTLRLHESVESARELIANVRDAHQWNASQRTNEIMKRLTILSAIFLPLSFITGFFGQNFQSLPFSSDTLMFLMLASCIAVPTGMLAYFVKSKWY